MPRAATWARSRRPSALARSRKASALRKRSGYDGLCPSENDIGRPAAEAIEAIRSKSVSMVSSSQSVTSWSTPCPVWPTAREIATSSSRPAAYDGVSSPARVLWLSVREVVKPSAPASIASAASLAISATSSSVASACAAARSPIARTRRAACGTWAAKSRSWGRRSSASRYSGKDCQSHASPSVSATPGMSSTPSISAISRPWSAGTAGAKPTPQLPITTVVTPCQEEGWSRLSQVA